MFRLLANIGFQTAAGSMAEGVCFDLTLANIRPSAKFHGITTAVANQLTLAC